MCTVTWLLEGGSFRLFCNRDELRTRKAALPPRVHRHEGVAYLAPIDGEAAGTWIAVNEHGLALCLLNDYLATVADRPEAFRSRGLLVTALAACDGLEHLERRWTRADLEPFRPFRLLALAPGRKPWIFAWNGVRAAVERHGIEPPLCSSSYDEQSATRLRRELLKSLSNDRRLAPHKRLYDFHRSHLPQRGPYSVCMHRPDALTVSFSLVEVDPERVALAYAPGPPCSTELTSALALARATVGV